MVWTCGNFPSCDVRVGVNPDGSPLGTPAGPELRALRKTAHDLFDVFWKRNYPGGNRKNSRGWGYKYLQIMLSLPSGMAHIGKLNEDQCNELIHLLKMDEADMVRELWNKDCGFPGCRAKTGKVNADYCHIHRFLMDRID